jgi:hypothetical protein
MEEAMGGRPAVCRSWLLAWMLQFIVALVLSSLPCADGAKLRFRRERVADILAGVNSIAVLLEQAAVLNI